MPPVVAFQRAIYCEPQTWHSNSAAVGASVCQRAAGSLLLVVKPPATAPMWMLVPMRLLPVAEQGVTTALLLFAGFSALHFPARGVAFAADSPERDRADSLWPTRSGRLTARRMSDTRNLAVLSSSWCRAQSLLGPADPLQNVFRLWPGLRFCQGVTASQG